MNTNETVRTIEATIQWLDDPVRPDPQDVLFGVFPSWYVEGNDEGLPYDEQIFFWLRPDEAEVMEATGTLPSYISDEWRVISKSE